MKKILFIFTFLILLFTSCSKESKQEKEAREAREEIEFFLKSILSDPNSLEIYSLSESKDYGIYEWEVDYSARNGFGGRIREKTSIKMLRGRVTFYGKRVVTKINNEYILLNEI